MYSKHSCASPKTLLTLGLTRSPALQGPTGLILLPRLFVAEQLLTLCKQMMRRTKIAEAHSTRRAPLPSARRERMCDRNTLVQPVVAAA